MQSLCKAITTEFYLKTNASIHEQGDTLISLYTFKDDHKGISIL